MRGYDFARGVAVLFSGGGDASEYPWVVKPPVYFNSIDNRIEKTPGSMSTPAEAKLKERQALLDQLFRS